jgi:hypothetical protein
MQGNCRWIYSIHDEDSRFKQFHPSSLARERAGQPRGEVAAELERTGCFVVLMREVYEQGLDKYGGGARRRTPKQGPCVEPLAGGQWCTVVTAWGDRSRSDQTSDAGTTGILFPRASIKFCESLSALSGTIIRRIESTTVLPPPHFLESTATVHTEFLTKRGCEEARIEMEEILTLPGAPMEKGQDRASPDA